MATRKEKGTLRSLCRGVHFCAACKSDVGHCHACMGPTRHFLIKLNARSQALDGFFLVTHDGNHTELAQRLSSRAGARPAGGLPRRAATPGGGARTHASVEGWLAASTGDSPLHAEMARGRSSREAGAGCAPGVA
jgi:hypothetical protein